MKTDENNGITKKTTREIDPEKKKYLSSLPDYLVTLHEGEGIPIKSKINMEEKPSWLDEDLFRRGQAFAIRNEAGLIITELICLFITYNIKLGIQPIIYSGQAIYLFEGYKRYMNSHKYFNGFYTGEPWCKGSPANRSLKIVHGYHEKYRQKIKNENPEDVKKLTTISGKGISKPYTGLLKEALMDFKESCPFALKIEPIHKENELVFFSQMIMAGGQMGFFAPAILRPDIYGIHNETEKDFEGFVHVWRVIGYYLGIKDKYNACQGTLQEVRKRIKETLEHWERPSLSCVDEEWAHMTHIAVDSIGLSWKIYYSTVLLLFCEMIDIPATHIRRALSFSEWFQYKVVKFILNWLFRIPYFKKLITSWISKTLKKDMQFSPDHLKYIHDLATKFEKNIH